MKHIKADLRKIAISASKLVLSNADEVGKDDQEIAAIKKRMSDWVKVLEQGEKRLTEIQQSGDTTLGIARRIEALFVRRDGEFEKIFGG